MAERMFRTSMVGKYTLRRFHVRVLVVWLAWGILSAGGLPSAHGGVAVNVPSPITMDKGETLEMGTALNLEADSYWKLRRYQSVRLVDFPLSETERVDLVLEQFHLATPETRIVAGTDEGDIAIPAPEIMLFRGVVSGRPQSRVVLGVSPRGMQGTIRTAEESYAFSPRRGSGNKGNRGSHVILRKSELPAALPEGRLERSLSDAIPWPGTVEQEGLSAPRLPGSFQVCRLALDCDYEFWQRFLDYGAALDYIYTLFADIGDIFERDVSSKITLTYIRIWTTVNDPYSYVGGECTGLDELKSYWTQHHNPGQAEFIERDVTHLLSSRGVCACAWEGVLCSYEGGFSISGGIALLPTEAQNLFHDTHFAGHEIGHNFNGHHTHCLIDPATNDWIDKCATEPGCNQTPDCSTAPSSIMSYCADCGGLTMELLEFDSVNIGRIRSHVSSSCLRLARNPAYVDWRNTSGTEDGTAANPYNTIKEGTEAVLPYGAVSIANGSYPVSITIWQPMVLNATGGSVVIGQ
jgi:hypothetical protein